MALKYSTPLNNKQVNVINMNKLLQMLLKQYILNNMKAGAAESSIQYYQEIRHEIVMMRLETEPVL